MAGLSFDTTKGQGYSCWLHLHIGDGDAAQLASDVGHLEHRQADLDVRQRAGDPILGEDDLEAIAMVGGREGEADRVDEKDLPF